MLRLLLTAVALNFLLVAPLWWRFGGVGTPLIAWEAWVVAAGMRLLPPSLLRRWLAMLVVAWVVVVIAANLGDAATHSAFGRSLNLYFDLPLLRSIYHLLVGNVGQILAVALILLGTLLMGFSVGGVLWLLLPASRLTLRQPQGKVAFMLWATATVLALLEANNSRWIPESTLPAINTTRFQYEQVTATHRARSAFIEQLESTPIEMQAMPGLEGRNVLLTFIESYGVSAIEDPRYNQQVLWTLKEMENRLHDNGLYVVSGVLESPVRGGQSWLAHATTLSGRWIDNSLWYRLMLNSGHTTLINDFKATGQRTLSVMPAITMAWPEGLAYGFDEIAAAHDIPYKGPALNWVTMPDQYTLDYTQRHLLGASPVFAQIALISSHAPWTPILPVLENWSMIGDGSIYRPWKRAGDPPDVLWREIERVRDHYAWSVDYTVNVAGRWAERVVDDNTLLIVLGDHQAAPLITGENASAAVPVHIISGERALVLPFLNRGFVEGTLPMLKDTEHAPKMSQLRHWLQEDFGPSTPQTRMTP